MEFSDPDEPTVIEELKGALAQTAYVEDLVSPQSLLRFPDGVKIMPFRLDPAKSLEDLAETNRILAALKAHQEGDPTKLKKIAQDLAAYGIDLEIKTYPGTDLITGVVLVTR